MPPLKIINQNATGTVEETLTPPNEALALKEGIKPSQRLLGGFKSKAKRVYELMTSKRPFRG